MDRYLLDTNHAGALLRDEHSHLWTKLQSLKRTDCGLCRPGVGELWFMVFNSERVDANRPRLEALLGQFVIYELDERSAIEFGSIRAALRRKGKPIPALDVLIAAIAMVNDLVLVTADTHFAHVDGLKVENWLTENP